MALLPLLMERVGILASTLAGIFAPAAALVGSLTKAESSSNEPPMIWPSTVQSCTLPLPSILTLLPGLPRKAVMFCAETLEATSNEAARAAMMRCDFIEDPILFVPDQT